MDASYITGGIIGKSAATLATQENGLKEGEAVMSSGDRVSCPTFLSTSGIEGERECNRENAGGTRMHLSDLRSQAGFAHWQRPSFPFPPIISTSPYAVLGKGGGAFLSLLSDDVIHSSAANKKPPPPIALTPNPQRPAPPLETPPRAFLKSGTFSDLSGKKTEEQGVNPPSRALSYFTKLPFK